MSPAPKLSGDTAEILCKLLCFRESTTSFDACVAVVERLMKRRLLRGKQLYTNELERYAVKRLKKLGIVKRTRFPDGYYYHFNPRMLRKLIVVFETLEEKALNP